MHARLIPLPAVAPADLRAWRALAADAAEPNAFLDPRYLVPACHRTPGAADVLLVVVERRGEWLGLLAVTTKAVAPGLPVRATTTGGTFLTTYSDRHHPLVRAGHEEHALEALLRAVPAVGLPGLVQLQHFPGEGVLADALAAVLARTPMLVHERRRVESAFAARPCPPASPVTAGTAGTAETAETQGSPGATRPDRPPRTSGSHAPASTGPRDLGPVLDLPLAYEHMGAGRRKDVRRRIRALERAAGGPLLLQDVSDDPTADEDFLAVQAEGWKGDTTRGGAAVALDPAMQRWFRDALAGFRRDGDLLALRIVAGGRTQWTGYSLRSGGAYVGFLDAFAEEHRHLSPGAIGRLVELTHVLTATDARHLDPAFDPRYAVGATIYPDRRTHVDLLVSVRGLVARSAVRAAPVARRIGFKAQVLVLPLAPESQDLGLVLALVGA